ncbi:Proteasome component (PCI) domain [Lasallia pustulata]|uniref:Proteasome component (PCI) domain n=1 Tax=Lasallia pustulata TaxID=136370 RepID=A0A1W5CZE7_9LECA|nr:Proteasome component (PCI) domain [Lasallia pustulata]
MDSTQQKALSALEPFLLLSKSATTPRSAADLITRATSHPHTYLFAELLQTPNIQSLRDAPPEYSEHLTLLEIYTWGTWADYNRVPDLPPLTDAQTLKLRHLTLLTLCASPLPTTLTYPSLLTSLSIPTPLALETLIISAIYANLLTATLSPLTSRVHVTSIAPLRDPPTNSLPRLISILSDWDRRCMGALRELEAQVQDIRGRAKEERRREREAREAGFLCAGP